MSASAVDEERDRLAKAEALLGCLAFGLLYSDDQEDYDVWILLPLLS